MVTFATISLSRIQLTLQGSVTSLWFSGNTTVLEKGRRLLVALHIHEVQLLLVFDKGTLYLLQTHLVLPKPGLSKSNNTSLFNIATSPLITKKHIASYYHLLPRKKGGREKLPPAGWLAQSRQHCPKPVFEAAPSHTLWTPQQDPHSCCFHICSSSSSCISWMPRVPRCSPGISPPASR